MRLKTGTRLGSYEIVALLGAGGMGEVYRATDTNLSRQVAIKTLPDAVATDPDRLARFDREARALASLNHPNIAAIYGLERHAGVSALIMELVEGPTLADRLASGPLPVDDALRIAAAIAEAIGNAHERGIIHRDLKPANIKVRPDGAVKVLDFGLAKAITDTTVLAAAAGMTVTATSPLTTQAGTVVGTAAYMSPEQARGEAVDQRTDIWAFGCLLYEMLAGRRAFGGATATDTLAKILEGQADLGALPAATPPPIRRLIRRCLERSPGNRLQHIGDARADIVDVRGGDEDLSAASARKHPVTAWRPVAWAAAAALALAALAALAFWAGSRRLPANEQRPAVVRFDVARIQVPPVGPVSRHLAVSPDGARLVYATASSLRMRSLDGEDVPLPAAGREPFFSPDGEWLGFFSTEGLRRMPANGGPDAAISSDFAGIGRTLGATWGPDGTIVVASGGSLWRVDADGGKPELVAEPDARAGEVRYGWPEFLPDGRSLLFTILRAGGTADARIAVIDLATRGQKTVIEGGHAARYAATGHLVYASGGNLQAVPFDAATRSTRGVPARVALVRIAETTGGFNANFDVSRTAAPALVYLPPAPPRLRTLGWVDRQGREEAIDAAPMEYVYPRLSPDGTRVALDVTGANRDIWVWHFARNVMSRITDGPTEDLMPAWSADGARVFFASDREGGAFRIYSVAADGAGRVRQEFSATDSYMPVSIPNANEIIAFTSGPGTRGGDLAVITLSGDARARPLLAREGAEANAVVSPDGRWIAYQSMESGTGAEVYIRPYPDVERRREQISRGGGLQPLWGRPGSNELFYVSLDGVLKVVSLTLLPNLAIGAARDVPLPDGYAPGLGGAWSYQVSQRDGRLLLMKPASAAAALAPIKVIVNWQAELNRLSASD